MEFLVGERDRWRDRGVCVSERERVGGVDYHPSMCACIKH
jgi:hypothetical protein